MSDALAGGIVLALWLVGLAALRCWAVRGEGPAEPRAVKLELRSARRCSSAVRPEDLGPHCGR